MLDLFLDSDFSVKLGDTNDLEVVEGRAELEQAIALRLTEQMHSNIIGEVDADTIIQKLQLEARRLVNEDDRIDSVADVAVTEGEAPNTYTASIVYESDEISTIPISE